MFAITMNICLQILMATESGFLSDCVVWLEGFTTTRRRIQEHNVRRHGGCFARERGQATHIVCDNKPVDRGATVITAEWLEDSLKEGRCLPLERYRHAVRDKIYTNAEHDPDSENPWNGRPHYRVRGDEEFDSDPSDI